MTETNAPSVAPPTGGDHLRAALAITGCAWVVAGLLQALLYLRPTPLGVPLVAHWDRYLFHALFYEFAAVAAAALPFLLLWTALHRRTVRPGPARAAHAALVLLLAGMLWLDGADHEVLRFMGARADPAWLAAYLRPGALGPTVRAALWADRGGAGLGLALPFLAAAGFLLAAHRLAARVRAGRHIPRWSVAPIAAAALVTAWEHQRPRSTFRKRRVEPAVFHLVRELLRPAAVRLTDDERVAWTRAWRERWLAESGDAGWEFPDPDRPFLRVPAAGSAATGDPATGRWNVIYLQLETLRGWDFGLELQDGSPSPTPFLDSLAAGPEGGWFARAMSYGPPTINSVLAAHCSLPPHSTRHVLSQHTGLALECLPQVLRRHGWRTLYVTGSDPDWDNVRFWLLRWYDDFEFPREADENDRRVFRRSADRIRALAASGEPFFAAVASISGHYPFRPREDRFRPPPQAGDRERIRAALRFTDDAVREFLTDLAAEPWFARTIVVVAGDHGFELGEHGGTRPGPGPHHASVWVPIVLAGRHPGLPRGRRTEPAGLVDLAPTIADLLGIREPTAWVGRSLLRRPLGTLTGSRLGLRFAEAPGFSLAFDPERGGPRLFAAADPRQLHDVAAAWPEAARDLLERAIGDQLLVDWAIENDRVWPREGVTSRRAP